MARFSLGVLAYLVPTFAIGYCWHLTLFPRFYKALAVYRPDIVVPLGFLAILV